MWHKVLFHDTRTFFIYHETSLHSIMVDSRLSAAPILVHYVAYKPQKKKDAGYKNGRKSWASRWRMQCVLILSLSSFWTPHPWPVIYIQGFSRVHWDNKHRHTNPTKLSFFALFLDCALLHVLLPSFTVWIFLLFIEEGFALAQKTKGKIDIFTALLR